MMTAISIFIHLALGLDQPLTTDDSWDCWDASDGSRVCERTIEPCRWDESPDECKLVVTFEVE